MWIIVIVFAVVLGFAAWVRLAPSDEAVWHVDPMVTVDQDMPGGVRRRVEADAAAFAMLHAIVLETPRTEVLAGGLDEGRVTYITRSKVMGFPDYTTVQLTGDVLEIYGRLRFGMSDLGVNKARVTGWLAQLRARRG